MASCNCMYPSADPRCCMNRPMLRLGLSDRTEPYPPMPLEWWRQVTIAPYTPPVVPDWWYENSEGHWFLNERGQWTKFEPSAKPSPDYNDDMRC